MRLPLGVWTSYTYRVQQVIFLRHCKSDWSTGAADHDRPLAPRGLQAREQVADFLSLLGIPIGRVLCSTSLRTRETLAPLWDRGLVARHVVHYHEQLYEASLEALLGVLDREISQNSATLVVGHNPGIELAVGHLSGDHLLIKTGHVVILQWDQRFSIQGASARMVLSYNPRLPLGSRGFGRL